MRYTRRQVLSLAGGLAVVAAPPVLATASRDYDVIVLGSGASGCVAAIRAAESGARALVLEKAAWLGGSSRVSTGIFGCAGHPIQRALGINTTPEDLYQLYIGEAAATKTYADKEAARLLADGAIPAADWLAELGVEWSTKRAQKFFLNIKEGHRLGELLLNSLEKRARELGVTFLTATPATKVLLGDGRVTGVEAEAPAGRKTFIAGAVVIATGGYEASPEMLARYVGHGWDKEGFYTTPHNTGDGQRMAEAAGASLADMEVFKSNPFLHITPEGNKQSLAHMVSGGAIAVNVDGHRFLREDGGYYQAWRVKEAPRGLRWLIFGEPLVAADPKASARVRSPLIVKADSLAELARRLGLPAAALGETVSSYQAMVKAGKDTDFGRLSGLRDVFSPPFYAVPFRAMVQGTFGGVRTNTQTEALDASGRVIPGLYAVGEAAAAGLRGLNPQTANVVFGSAAGRNSAAFAARR